MKPNTVSTEICTEAPNSRSKTLGSMSALEIAALMNEEDFGVADAVRGCLKQIARAIEWAAASVRRGGRLIYVGAGTSGRIATLDASECPPTFGVAADTVIAVMAGGKDALLAAREGVEDDTERAVECMSGLDVCGRDTVVGVAASGTTPFTLAALKHARSKGARTVALVSNPSSPMQRAAHLTICTLVGPEVLTGSTRLKSATAHKMVLNMLSTGCMVQNGKVYKNFMVDAQPTNQKLRSRAVRIVQRAAEVDLAEAEAALVASGMRIKPAVLMCLARVDADAAQRALDSCQGFVDRAVVLFKGVSE